MTNKYYQKRKERLGKDVSKYPKKKYPNLSEEKKDKRWKNARE